MIKINKKTGTKSIINCLKGIWQSKGREHKRKR
jgi:hypothetical protein